MLVAHDDEGAKAETPPTFNDFRRAIDKHHLLGQLGALLASAGTGIRPAFRRTTAAGTPPEASSTASTFTATATATATFDWFCHSFFLVKLKLQAGLAVRIGQCFDLSGIFSPAAIKDNLFDAFALGGFR